MILILLLMIAVCGIAFGLGVGVVWHAWVDLFGGTPPTPEQMSALGVLFGIGVPTLLSISLGIWFLVEAWRGRL